MEESRTHFDDFFFNKNRIDNFLIKSLYMNMMQDLKTLILREEACKLCLGSRKQ